MPNNRIPPSPPPPPPIITQPRPHFGVDGTTPISPRFPQSSSAGSAINPGGLSHLGGPSSLQDSVAGNIGHTDPIPQTGLSTAPKRPLSPDGAQPLPPRPGRGRPRVDGGMDVADMPPELTNGSEGFWGNRDPATRQLAVNLFRDGKIHDITYSNDGKEINGEFNYFGKEYRFSYSGRRDSLVVFRDMDGNNATPSGIMGRKFSTFLHVIEGAPAPLIEGAPEPAPPRPRMIMQNAPASFSIPDELNPPAAGNFWTKINRHIQLLLTKLYRNREIYGIYFSRSLGGSPRLNAVMRYQGRDYAFFIEMRRRLTFAPGVVPPPGFHNSQGVREALQKLAGSTLPRDTGST